MAALTPVFWETGTPTMREVLTFIGQCTFAPRFYLAGGTALALRLGHRRSVDLDFFSNTDEIGQQTRREILDTLSPLRPQALEDVEGNLLLEIHNMHVGFFGYSYPLLAPTDSVEGVAIAGIVDIGLMKLDALISRGSRKDFYDLYFILQKVSLNELLILGRTKYPYARDFELMAIESLIWFDNADRDLQPRLLTDVTWDEVKCFFVAKAQALGEDWFSARKEF
ncbi:MAG TPA: nucleotidyl transferase AbiEii/AbiGii toxin family protein [Anaerolineae bacterium]|nr:nucleotidyl transferase AbiEii/AbiGii toxin family protein [Anaerolineae bacterium]HQH38371.1 nucleotidyl transferase AbiEii/AbiGii toxin family protein [Anaerolineae bacterium]